MSTPGPTYGLKITADARACDNDRCDVLTFRPGAQCPGCGSDGFDVHSTVEVDQVTP